MPQQQHHLKTLPPNKVTVVRRNGKTYYVYEDPAHNQIYVGSQFQYYRYRDLRLEKIWPRKIFKPPVQAIYKFSGVPGQNIVSPSLDPFEEGLHPG